MLHDQLGFREMRIPDAVFDHDLQYGRAVSLIRALRETAARLGLTFGVKLSNTLAMSNHTARLPGGEMYMSGRALYPVTMRLYDRLLHEFGGDLHVSFSAGADADNVATVLACGALPVTGCTDLLKPGGVARLAQWLARVEAAMRQRGASTVADLSRDRLANVRAAADEAARHPRYKKPAFPHGLPKVTSALGLWDCVVAPCVEACAVEQDVPEYAWHIARGEYDRALETILARNPLPGVTGYVCTRLCQTKCTRNDYEESVAIRALKRVADERGRADYASALRDADRPRRGHRRRRAVRAGGRRVPGAERRAGDHFREEGRAGRHDARRAAVPPAVGDRPARHRSDPRARRRAPTEHAGDRPARTPARSGLRRGLPGQRIPARRAASRAWRRWTRRHPGAAAARSIAPRRAGRPRQRGGGHRRRRHRHGRGAHRAALHRSTGHAALPANAAGDAGRRGGTRRRPRGGQPPRGARHAGGDRSGRRSRRRRQVREELAGRRRAGRPKVAGCRSRAASSSSPATRSSSPSASCRSSRSSTAAASRGTRGAACSWTAPRARAGPNGVFAGGDVVIEPGSIISACADGRAAAEAICEHLGVPFAERPWLRPTLSDDDIVAIKGVRARRIPAAQPADAARRSARRLRVD